MCVKVEVTTMKNGKCLLNIIIMGIIAAITITGCGRSEYQGRDKSASTSTATVANTPKPTPTPAPTQEPTVLFEVTEVEPFCNGVALVHATNTTKSERRIVAVNTDGEVIYTTDEYESEEIIVHPQKGLVASPATHKITKVLDGGDGYYMVQYIEEGLEVATTRKAACITSEGEYIMEPTLAPNDEQCYGARYIGAGRFIVITWDSMGADSGYLYDAVSNTWGTERNYVDELYDLYAYSEDDVTISNGQLIKNNGETVMSLPNYVNNVKSCSAQLSGNVVLLDMTGADNKGYYALLNISGEEIIPPTVYHDIPTIIGDISNIENGYFVVQDGSHYTTIGPDGNVRAEFDTSLVDDYLTLQEGWMTEKFNGYDRNFINLDGKEMFPNQKVRIRESLL